MPGLGALAEFHLDHLDLRVSGGGGEFSGVELAIGRTAAEIAGADFPYEVTTALAVVGADGALTRVMREAANPRAAVQRADGIGRKGAETHRRYVEDGCVIGFAALRTADHQAEAAGGNGPGRDGVVEPFELALINIVVRAERPLVELVLRPLVDDGALVPRERHAALLILEEILADLRADVLKHEAQMPKDRVIAQHRVPGLQQIVNAQQGQRESDQQRRKQQRPPAGESDSEKKRHDRYRDGDRQCEEPFVENQHQAAINSSCWLPGHYNGGATRVLL